MASRTLGKLICSSIKGYPSKNIRNVAPILRLYSTPATGTQGKTLNILYSLSDFERIWKKIKLKIYEITVQCST